MSIIANIHYFDLETKELINKDLYILINKKKIGMYQPPPKEIVPYIIDEKKQLIYLPFYYAVNNIKLSRKPRNTFTKMNLEFNGSLRENQLIVKKEALNILNKKSSVILSLHVGFGKTICSINLACEIKLKTLIIVNKIVLMNQWQDAIMKVCPSAIVQKITTKTKSKFNEDADFYIINAINVEKLGCDYFSNIGLCIVDEIHLIMAETLSKSLLYISPRYLIGLSATPYRDDGLDPLFNFFFGDDECKIIREMNRKHRVYKVYTGFTPEMVTTENGTLNWSSIINEQSTNIERNELIISIAKKYSDRRIMIITKRIDQGNYLYNRLLEENELVTSLLGSNQDFDKSSRILVGSLSKIGCGFDHSVLDTLILASDVEAYFIQTLGRVFRKNDETVPYIFDLVDDNPVLLRHFKTRVEVYKKTGGEIINYIF
jgi:superfamily II DNA or RNA helicase